MSGGGLGPVRESGPCACLYVVVGTLGSSPQAP